MGLKAHERQHALNNRTKANQYYKQLEKISQPPITNKSIDNPKANCPHNDNNQNPDYGRNHSTAFLIYQRLAVPAHARRSDILLTAPP